MEARFKKLVLHESERAEETWVNLDHVVAVTPDPQRRFTVVVLDVLDLSGFSWGPKVYKATYESGRELVGS